MIEEIIIPITDYTSLRIYPDYSDEMPCISFIFGGVETFAISGNELAMAQKIVETYKIVRPSHKHNEKK